MSRQEKSLGDRVHYPGRVDRAVLHDRATLREHQERALADERAAVRWDRLVHGECLEEMRKLPAGCADIIFADPPYNLQLEGELYRPDESEVKGVKDSWDHFESFASYDEFSQAWLYEAQRLLAPHGTIWVMGSYHNIYRLGYHMQNLGFWILNDVVWCKINPMPNFRGCRLTNAHETLIWACRGREAQYTFNYKSLKCYNDDVQMRSDWYLSLCSGKERLRDAYGKKLHGAQKPEALLTRIVLASSKPGDRILDPFVGTGTSAVVAKRLGRRYLGFDRDSSYIKAARARLRKVEAYPHEVLDTVPSARDRPRISFGRLLEAGLVVPGSEVQSGCSRWRAQVRADGHLLVRDSDFVGSIHQTAAFVQNMRSCNGWFFWKIEVDKSENGVGMVKSLDDLRQQLRLRDHEVCV